MNNFLRDEEMAHLKDFGELEYLYCAGNSTNFEMKQKMDEAVNRFKQYDLDKYFTKLKIYNGLSFKDIRKALNDLKFEEIQISQCGSEENIIVE